MASRWYVDQGGEQLGPLRTVELRQLAARGDVQPKTPVRRGNEGDWVPAGKVVGLIPTQSQAAPPKAEAIPVAAAIPVAKPVAQPMATATEVAASPATPPAPAIRADSPRSRLRKSRRPSDVPFSLAAGMLVVLLLTASLGVAGVFIYVWRAGEDAAASQADQPTDRTLAEKPEEPPPPAASSPDQRDEDLLQAIDRWHDAARMRVGPRKTARYQVASARLATPAQLEQLAEPHVVRKEQPLAPSPRPRPTVRTALSGGDVNVDPSFDDPLEAEPTLVDKTPEARESPSDPPSLPSAAATSGEEMDTDEPSLLVVELHVTNLSAEESLHYDGMNGFAKDETAALLVDDLGKRFLPLPPSEASSLRRVAEFDIAPGHTLTDVLVFPAPEAGFEYLRLALPNASIGRSGGIGFEIRRAMIDEAGPLDSSLARVDAPDAPAVTPSPKTESKAPPAGSVPATDAPETIDNLRRSISKSLGDE